MMRSPLADAFEHHVWATLQIIDTCELVPSEQLDTIVPGTYGSIIETLRHLVGADAAYLFVLTDGETALIDEETMNLAELRAAMEAHAEAWVSVLSAGDDPETVVVRRRDDGSEAHAPLVGGVSHSRFRPEHGGGGGVCPPIGGTAFALRTQGGFATTDPEETRHCLERPPMACWRKSVPPRGNRQVRVPAFRMEFVRSEIVRHPLGVRLAQAVHHGTDHRSQICTALTTLGVTPPEIDVWAYAFEDDRLREFPPA